MTEHTPGPWIVKEQASGELGIYQTKDHDGLNTSLTANSLVATVRHKREEYINANLIAAAPDLLEALIDLLRETDGGTNLCAEKFVTAAGSAITKATAQAS